MEDGDNDLCPSEGRDGSWSYEWGSSLTPTPADLTVSRGGSTKSLYLSTSDSSSDDLVMRAKLTSAAPHGHDLSDYSGIRFWARGFEKGAPNEPLPVEVWLETESTLPASEGTCVAGCGDHFVYSVGEVDEDWQEFFVPLYGMFQSGAGTAVDLDLSEVVAVSFHAPRDGALGQTLRVDDVRFVTGVHYGERPSSDIRGVTVDTMALTDTQAPGYDTTTNGNAEVLGPLDEKDMFIKFDLSGVDPEARVESAVLRLEHVSAPGTIGGLGRVLWDWDEDTMTGATAPTAVPIAGDPGLLVAETSEVRINLPVALVEFWLRNPGLNHGIRLQGGANTIASSELLTVQEARPELVLVTASRTLPPTSTGCGAVEIIDDFEDGNVTVCDSGGRFGSAFYTPWNNDEVDSSPRYPEAAYLPSPRGASRWGIHADLQDIERLGIRIARSESGGVDVSQYDGIEFFVRTDVENYGSFRVQIHQDSTVPPVRGGSCDASCDTHYELELPLPTTDWARATALFAAFQQPYWVSHPQHLDTTGLMGFTFGAHQEPGSRDLWLDDIRFVRGTRFGEGPSADVSGVTTDSYVYTSDLGGGEDALNYGSSDQFFFSSDTQIFVRFDVSSISGGTVRAAALKLYGACSDRSCSHNYPENNLTAEVVDAAWAESSVTGQNAPGASTLAGTSRAHGQLASMSLTLDPTVVQSWIDSPSTNHGLRIRRAATVVDMVLHSSEAADPALRPMLVVLME